MDAVGDATQGTGHTDAGEHCLREQLIHLTASPVSFCWRHACPTKPLALTQSCTSKASTWESGYL